MGIKNLNFLKKTVILVISVIDFNASNLKDRILDNVSTWKKENVIEKSFRTSF